MGKTAFELIEKVTDISTHVNFPQCYVWIKLDGEKKLEKLSWAHFTFACEIAGIDPPEINLDKIFCLHNWFVDLYYEFDNRTKWQIFTDWIMRRPKKFDLQNPRMIALNDIVHQLEGKTTVEQFLKKLRFSASGKKPTIKQSALTFYKKARRFLRRRFI